MRRDERNISAVPWAVQALVIVALMGQLYWGMTRGLPTIKVAALPQPPSAAVLRIMAFGQPEILARLMMLWLQAFDYQPGVSIAFRDLDYARVQAWLARMLELDPRFQYPLLAAARLYGEVGEPDKQRRMLDFTARHFRDDPAARWQWMAHAVYLAKHRLGDLELALALARELSRIESAADIPSWARQMHIFVLEDMGELESAKVLLGGLLESGEITDPHEQWFLSQRLSELEQRASRKE